MTAPDERARATRAILDMAKGSPDYNRAAGDWALDVLGVADPLRRETLHAWFIAVAVEFEHQNYGKTHRPPGREVVGALQSIAEGARAIDDGMTVLRHARMTAMPGASDAEEYRRVLFRLMVGEIQRAFGLSETEWADDSMQDPLTDAFARICRWATILAERFDVGDVAGPSRTGHPAMVTLIGRLGQLYEEETGRRPSAPRSGDRPGYMSPFERFVTAFMPLVGVDPPPSAKAIARALELYHLFTPKI